MRVLIEVLADDRDQAVTLLRGAVQAVRYEKERSGQAEHSCLGDYRITVTEEEEKAPYVSGDRVRVKNKLEARFGRSASVKHLGPGYTGVTFTDGHKQTYRNEDLEPDESKERTLGSAVLRFAVGDRVRCIAEGLEATETVLPETVFVQVPVGTTGIIEEQDRMYAESEFLVIWDLPRAPWSWLSSGDIDIVPVTPPAPASCSCRTPGCSTGPECFGGSDSPEELP